MDGVSSPSLVSRRRKRVRRALTIAVAAAAAIVVVLLVLIAGGILVLPSHAAAPVTISYVQIHVLEGNTSGGVPWFGPGSPEKNYTAGYPIQLAAGSNVDVPMYFFNYDNVSHSLETVQATSIPKEYVPVTSTSPSLPVKIPPSPESIEGQNFLVYVTIPSTPGATYVLVVTVSAFTAS